MDEQIVEVDLLADCCDGKPVYESVPAVCIGENRYRLACSPGFAPGVASGDEIELTPSEKIEYRILKRSGNLCIQLFLTRYSSDDRAEMVSTIESIGGWLDGGYDDSCGHLLIFTIPVSSGFDVIEKVMDQISAKFSVDRWMYGNVYDTRDGVTPLNWWL